MNFLDGHLFPEHQPPLIITAAPYAPGWLPSDFPALFNTYKDMTVPAAPLRRLSAAGIQSAFQCYARCGTEDCLWDQRRTAKQSTVRQIEQLVRIAREFGRDIATAGQAREISRIGVFYGSPDETLAANGFAPNRNGGAQGFLRKTL